MGGDGGEGDSRGKGQQRQRSASSTLLACRGPGGGVVFKGLQPTPALAAPTALTASVEAGRGLLQFPTKLNAALRCLLAT